MKFYRLACFLSKLEKTSSRLEMTEILSQLFKRCSHKEIDKACYLCLGRLAPKYIGIEFNMAEKMIVRTLAVVFKEPIGEITKDYKREGDLGEVAFKFKIKNEKFKSAIQNSKLSVGGVYQRLLEIAQENGQRSQERKIQKMANLLKELDPLSRKYVVRIPISKLRLGFSDMTVLDALSWSKTRDKSLRKILERAFSVLADIGKIAKIFKAKDIVGIRKIKSEIGVPILPAKAERLKTPEEILEKMDGKCGLEPKYDGFRCQIHFSKEKKISGLAKESLKLFEEQKYFVRIFSRNLDNMTYMFPDVVAAAERLKAKSVILDGEAIAYNPTTGKFLPFQETVQRKRKHGVREKAKQLPLKVFCFDILNLNGKPLLDLPFKKRRNLLERLLAKSKGEEKGLVLTKQEIVKKPQDFETFFREVVSEGLEGLMAKRLDTAYQAGARNFNWVKYKAGMKEGLADTVDCVVMGYYRGRGKRASFGIGAFLVGVIKISNIEYQKERERKIEEVDQYVTVSKIGTGLTDKQWKEMFKRCEKLRVEKRPKEYKVDKNLFPDVWCLPELVVEIEADTITKSPIHTAGLALRFPRLKRFRDDKDPRQATFLTELERIVKVKKG